MICLLNSELFLQKLWIVSILLTILSLSLETYPSRPGLRQDTSYKQNRFDPGVRYTWVVFKRLQFDSKPTSHKLPSYCIIYVPKIKHTYAPNLSHVPHVLLAPCLDVPAKGRSGEDRGGKVGNKSLWLVGINKFIFSQIEISIKNVPPPN